LSHPYKDPEPHTMVLPCEDGDSQAAQWTSEASCGSTQGHCAARSTLYGRLPRQKIIGPLQKYMLRLDAVGEGVSEVVVSKERSENGSVFGAQVVGLASQIVFPEGFVFGKGEGL